MIEVSRLLLLANFCVDNNAVPSVYIAARQFNLLLNHVAGCLPLILGEKYETFSESEDYGMTRGLNRLGSRQEVTDYFLRAVSAENRSKIKFYFIPSSINDKLFELFFSCNEQERLLVHGEFEPLSSEIRAVMAQIERDFDERIDCILGSCHAACFHKAAEGMKIPYISSYRSPYRSQYNTAVGMLCKNVGTLPDFTQDNYFQRLYDGFLPELDHLPVLNPKQIMALMLKPGEERFLDSYDREPEYEMGFAISTNNAWYRTEITDEAALFQCIKQLNGQRLLIRSDPRGINRMAWLSEALPIDWDNSRTSLEFASRCRRICGISTGAVADGFLLNKIPYYFLTSGFALDSYILSGVFYNNFIGFENHEPLDERIINVFAFLFTIPQKWLFNDKYIYELISGRLTQRMIYETNITYHAARKGIPYSGLRGGLSAERVISAGKNLRYFVSYRDYRSRSAGEICPETSAAPGEPCEPGKPYILNIDIIENISIPDIAAELPWADVYGGGGESGGTAYFKFESENGVIEEIARYDIGHAALAFILEKTAEAAKRGIYRWLAAINHNGETLLLNVRMDSTFGSFNSISKTPVILYGANSRSENIINVLKRHNCPIIGFCDGSEEKINSGFLDYAVMSPAEAVEKYNEECLFLINFGGLEIDDILLSDRVTENSVVGMLKEKGLKSFGFINPLF